MPSRGYPISSRSLGISEIDFMTRGKSSATTLSKRNASDFGNGCRVANLNSKPRQIFGKHKPMELGINHQHVLRIRLLQSHEELLTRRNKSLKMFGEVGQRC